MPMRAEKLETRENSLISKPTSTRVQVKICAGMTKNNHRLRAGSSALEEYSSGLRQSPIILYKNQKPKSDWVGTLEVIMPGVYSMSNMLVP